MARFFYSLLVFLMLPWALVHLLWRARRQPEYLSHWGERFGHFGHIPVTAPLIWLHAVSVGETRAAQPLIAALRLRYPRHQILITHMTPTGRATSEALFGDSVLRCYLPYDTPGAVERFLAHFRPQFGLILETELWPNLIAICLQQNLPLLLVNARMSARSAKRYATLATLSRHALQGLRAIAAISNTDAERLIALGAIGAQTPVVTGNMKFDIHAPVEQLALGKRFAERIGARHVFLAASTREGEEVLLLDAWANCSPIPTPTLPLKGRELEPSSVGANNTGGPQGRKCPAEGTPLLVIVPRHPQRFAEVATLIAAKGLSMQRRSDDQAIDASTDVLLGDTMGEMFAWYAAADVAFIGGSLLDYGSQNLIEACAVGTPVLLGPSTFNFAEAASEAVSCGAARGVADASELVAQGLALLNDPALRAEMSAAGLAFAQRHRGATERTMEIIARSVG